MDRKQLVDMAHQASMTVSDNDDWEDGLAFVCDIAALERFAALVAANTRRQRDPVDSAIVQAVLPEAYSIINEMIRDAPELQKSLVVRARKLLPDTYSESFSAIRARGEGAARPKD